MENMFYELEIESDEYDLSLDDSDNIDAELGTAISNIQNTDYNPLINKPSINGVTLVGDLSSFDLGIDQTYIYNQNTASNVWTITHNLDKYPSVSVVDSAGSVVIGDILYVDTNNIILTFRGGFSGTAYLN